MIDDGIGNIAQSNEIAGSVNSLFGLSPLVTGVLLAALSYLLL